MLFFLPRQGVDKSALVVELKWDQGSDGAIEQIRDRRYLEEVKGGGEVLLVGVRCDVKDKRCECRVERGGVRRRERVRLVYGVCGSIFCENMIKILLFFYEKKRVELRKKGKNY